MTAEYVLYLRKSKGRKGISQQRRVTTAHIERLGGVIIGEYADTDRTAFQRVGGARPEREQFDLMLAELRAKPGLGVAAWHADRLVRSSGDTRTLIEICAASGHLIETPRGGSYDLSTATGRKRLRGDANDAEYEVDHLIERNTADKLEKALNGQWLGGPVPFGWQRYVHVSGDGDEERGLELCPPEAQAVADAIASITAGVSLHGICREWNAAGLVTKRGNQWHPQEVRRTLLRGRNAGLMEHQGKVLDGVTGNWPAIVSEAAWRQCAAILRDPLRRDTPGPGRRWLGSGLYLCGVCGEPMLVTLGGRPERKRKVYRCRHRRHVARDADTLDAYVGETIILRLQAPDAAVLFEPRRPDTAQLEAQLAAVGGELDELGQAVRDGAVTVRQMMIANKGLLERKARLEADLALAGRESPLKVFTDGDKAAHWYGMDLDRKRAVLAALLTVTVHPAPLGRTPGWRPGSPYFDPDRIEISWSDWSEV